MYINLAILYLLKLVYLFCNLIYSCLLFFYQTENYILFISVESQQNPPSDQSACPYSFYLWF
jgi:hypothetical protein